MTTYNFKKQTWFEQLYTDANQQIEIEQFAQHNLTPIRIEVYGTQQQLFRALYRRSTS